MDINIYEMRWNKLVQKLVDARAYSIRTDLEIQHVINLLALLEQEFPDHKPEDVSTDEDE